MTNLHSLSACEALEAIRRQDFSAASLVEACLDRIRAVEPRVEAWAFIDPDRAHAQAKDRDRLLADKTLLGPLHGLPVGIKDIFDTADMPTENGTVLHAGRRPAEDAMAVTLLRAAGAVILGKTVTTELAVYGPGKTRNPHNPDHTPGGSSSGSAAAVAAEMVPLAIGSQTNGSVIRPAAYCGVVGYKPTFGLISRTGALRQSRHLDHVGVFARKVEDAALLAHALMGFDDRDPGMRSQTPFQLAGRGEPGSPVPPEPGLRQVAVLGGGGPPRRAPSSPTSRAVWAPRKWSCRRRSPRPPRFTARSWKPTWRRVSRRNTRGARISSAQRCGR